MVFYAFLSRCYASKTHIGADSKILTGPSATRDGLDYSFQRLMPAEREADVWWVFEPRLP